MCSACLAGTCTVHGPNAKPQRIVMVPTVAPSQRLIQARRAARIWFYKPQWYWHGWKTLIPFMIGHDELARRTLLLGWTITGEVVIALGDCGDPECRQDAEEYLLFEEEMQ